MQRSLYRLLLHSLLLSCLSFMYAKALAADEARILVLGDSISAAYGMSLEQGWVARLESALNMDFPGYSVVNASISGDTTSGGLRRLPGLLERHSPTLVIIELGGNDGLRGYPVASLRANLEQMAELAQSAGAAVILLPMEIPPNYGARYASGFRESYRTVADATDSVLGPFILDGVATDPALMQADGIHPTAGAQAALLENVLPVIVDTLARL
jgi:acyl-CoA thioesterase-1